MGMLPSAEVQTQTKALLAKAKIQLLAPVMDQGYRVTEKNTFFHVEAAIDLSSDESTDYELPIRNRSDSVMYEVPSIRRRSSLTVTATRSHSCPRERLASPKSSGALPVKICVQTAPSSPIQQGLPSGKTTVMLRNVPYHEGQLGVLRMIESKGFGGKFDFFYAPLDFSSGNNLGYLFINLKSTDSVNEFFHVMDGLRLDEEGWSQKELRVCWARVQGLHANVQQYRNSPVNDMPLQFRPMLFEDGGVQVPFPRPDRHFTRNPTNQKIVQTQRRVSISTRV
jgi:RNA recognition motif 2